MLAQTYAHDNEDAGDTAAAAAAADDDDDDDDDDDIDVQMYSTNCVSRRTCKVLEVSSAWKLAQRACVFVVVVF